MKAPVGLSSRRPVCAANAVRSAQQGHSDFDALEPPLRLTPFASSPKGTPLHCAGNFTVMPRALPLGELAKPTGFD